MPTPRRLCALALAAFAIVACGGDSSAETPTAVVTGETSTAMATAEVSPTSVPFRPRIFFREFPVPVEGDSDLECGASSGPDTPRVAVALESNKGSGP